MGNFDVGGFFLPYSRSTLVLRAGLALPSASDSLIDVAANADAAFERLTDLLLIAPKYTTLRLSASTVQEGGGGAFFRGDFGFDLAIDKPSGGNGGVFLRANAAAGVHLTGDRNFKRVVVPVAIRVVAFAIRGAVVRVAQLRVVQPVRCRKLIPPGKVCLHGSP